MKSFLIKTVFLIFALGHAEAYAQSMRVVEDFQSQIVNAFPQDFVTYPFQRKKVLKIYHVRKEDDNLFLHAEDVPGMTMQVLKRFQWIPEQATHLSWRWRALALPKNAAENHPDSNDSACSVYVLYGGYGGRAVKYVWSTTLPVGSAMSKDDGQMSMVVMETGKTYVGQWRTVSVDVNQEYKKYFDGKVKEVKGFGILTDGDQTHSPSACDYDDFTITKPSSK